MNWNPFVNNIVVMFGLGVSAAFYAGLLVGIDHASPVFDITEIVQVEGREPLVMEAFSLECRLMPK